MSQDNCYEMSTYIYVENVLNYLLYNDSQENSKGKL